MNTVVSQALATGLPVIATIHSGLPEQVIEGKNGALAPEANHEVLAEKILFLLTHSELWPGFGLYGRSHVSNHYDSQVLSTRQIEYYFEVLEGPHRT